VIDLRRGHIPLAQVSLSVWLNRIGGSHLQLGSHYLLVNIQQLVERLESLGTQPHHPNQKGSRQIPLAHGMFAQDGQRLVTVHTAQLEPPLLGGKLEWRLLLTGK
jgi:hypothetical protein